MKVALVQLSNDFYQKNLYYNVAHICEPIGLCYVGAMAKKGGHEVKIIHQLDTLDEKVLEEITNFKPNVVGFSIMTSERKKGLKFAKELRKTIKPTILFGGPDVTTFPEIIWDDTSISSYAIIGEGEYSFLEFLNSKDGIWYGIPGLVSHAPTCPDVRLTKPPERIMDLDNLPFPLRDDLPMKRYKSIHLSTIPYSEQKYSIVIASRGCYYDCDMCQNRIIWGGKQVARSAESVVDEIELLIKNYSRNLIFLGDANPSKKTLESIANEILKRNIKIKWRSFLNVNEADISLYQLMRDSGYELGIFGIESGSNKELSAMHKGTTREKCVDAVHLAKKAGFFAHGTYMVGYPDEIKEEFLDSFKFLKTTGLDSVNFFYITPLPGTKFYEECKNRGIINTEDSDLYDLVHPVIKTKLERELGKNLYKNLLLWCQNNFYDEVWFRRAERSKYRDSYKEFIENLRLMRGLNLYGEIKC